MNCTCLYNEQFKDNIYLLLFITNKCNYNCSYCYNEKINSSIDINFENLKLFISNIRSQNKKKIFVNLIGGEPTLYTRIFDLAEFLNTIDNLETSIFTNLSQDENFYKQLILNNIFITASFHDNNKTTVSEFINKVKLINSKNMLKDVIVLYNTITDKSVKCFEEVLNINGSFNKEFDLIDGFEYTDEELKIFNNYKQHNNKCFTLINDNIKNELTFDYISRNFNFKKWICNAGKDSLYIHANGDIFECESCYSEKHKPIGNINLTPLFDFKKHATICNCIKCSGDYGIYKTKVFR